MRFVRLAGLVFLVGAAAADATAAPVPRELLRDRLAGRWQMTSGPNGRPAVPAGRPDEWPSGWTAPVMNVTAETATFEPHEPWLFGWLPAWPGWGPWTLPRERAGNRLAHFRSRLDGDDQLVLWTDEDFYPMRIYTFQRVR